MTWYVVGLGNPGEKFVRTRHNVGFLVCDALYKKFQFDTPTLIKKKMTLMSSGQVGEDTVTLLWPQTFMNLSGQAVKSVVGKDEIARLVVVYDDVDVPLGRIKVSFGGGAGGHNGLSNIAEVLGTRDFIRVRVGIGMRDGETGRAVRPVSEALSAYVLERFPEADMAQVEKAVTEATAVVERILSAGYVVAMNEWNGR